MVVKTTIEVVKFNDDFLEVVRVAANNAVGRVDGEYWVSVKKVCENLNINFATQFKKLKSDPSFEAKYIEVQTKGGLQKVFCIPLEKLNGWLFTINPNKVKPEVKQKLIAYKNECFKVLYNHFIQKATTPPQNCPADKFDSRINGYKSQLAQRKKEIESLRWELAVAHNKIQELQGAQSNLSATMLEHNLMDLAASYARLKEELQGRAETLEFVAKELKSRVATVDHFIEAIGKILPKAKDVADSAGKRHKKDMEFYNLIIKKN